MASKPTRNPYRVAVMADYLKLGPIFGSFAKITRLHTALERQSSVIDLTLRTKIQPLTLWVNEVCQTPGRETAGLRRTDQLFAMLDQSTAATLQRVDSETDAQFIVELVAIADPEVVSLVLRESIVVMATRQVSARAGLEQWETMADHFALMIDTAAECYANPLSVA